MPDKAPRELRDGLFFGLAAALLGLLLALGDRAVEGLDARRDARILAELSGATTVSASGIRIQAPRSAPRRLFSLRGAKAAAYGVILPLSLPGSSGLYAATFSRQGEVQSLVRLQPPAEAGGPKTEGLGFLPGSGSLDPGSPGNRLLAVDPRRAELAVCLAEISASILHASEATR